MPAKRSSKTAAFCFVAATFLLVAPVPFLRNATVWWLTSALLLAGGVFLVGGAVTLVKAQRDRSHH